jgi:hypothetical protein
VQVLEGLFAQGLTLDDITADIPMAGHVASEYLQVSITFDMMDQLESIPHPLITQPMLDLIPLATRPHITSVLPLTRAPNMEIAQAVVHDPALFTDNPPQSPSVQ